MMNRTLALVALAAVAVRAVADVEYVAHQGEEALAPSHSRPAYEFAVRHGLERIKLDLRETKDGEIVMQHDDTLKVTMGWDVKIRKHTLAEIREKGRCRARGGFTNETIVTLAEALEYGKRTKKGVWLDFKDFSPALMKKAFDLCEAAGLPHDRIMIATWTKPALRHAMTAYPDVARVAHTFIRQSPDGGFTTNSGEKDRVYATEDELIAELLRHRDELKLTGFNLPHVVRRGKVIYHTTEKVVRALKAAGCWISIWFVNDPETGELYRRFGADNFVTSCAERTRPAKPLPEAGLCGHQGNCAAFPGNTAEGIADAIRLGVAMVEFDAQRCKSGEFVLMHDGTIDNLTTGKGRISEHTLAELKSYRLKSRKGQYRLATLDEALDVIPKDGVWINLHCYCGRPNIGDLARHIKERGRLHQTCFCANLKDIEEARKAVPELIANNIQRPGPRNRDWTPEECRKFVDDSIAHKCRFLQLCRPWPREYSDACHAADIKVIHFKSDDPAELPDLKARGIDFVMTNHPGKMGVYP